MLAVQKWSTSRPYLTVLGSSRGFLGRLCRHACGRIEAIRTDGKVRTSESAWTSQIL